MSNPIRQPEHSRRKLLNSVMPPDLREWVYPDGDDDCNVKVPYGPHQGKTLGQLLETYPQYLAYLTGPRCSHVQSPFTAALFRVAKRYEQRVNYRKSMVKAHEEQANHGDTEARR